MDPAAFEWNAMHGWAIATAAMVSAGCAVVGTLLVVRRMSLLGDAISHAVLPGIAVAVLAGGRPGGPLVLLGAVAAALVTVGLTQVLRSEGGLAEDSSAGVVFTTLFAAGVVLITAAASRIDLDPSCVLYGILELVPFDTISIAGLEMPRAFVTAGLVFATILLGCVLTWKEQLFAAFDPDAARAAGMPVTATTIGLLAAAALATVASFEAVGAILVVAMLVVPAATAELLSRRLHRMMLLAVVIAVVSAAIGYLAAWHWNTSAAGMIAVVLGAAYVLAAVAAPQDGLVARFAAQAALNWRVTAEDCLAFLWREEESSRRGPESSDRGGWTLRQRVALAWMSWAGGVLWTADGWRLTDSGRTRAETVVRSHRLWEAWLGHHVKLPLDHLHPPAEWIEHHLGADVRARIEAEVGGRDTDPHGRAIPPEQTS
jgi:manganese/zinc/iron transport system permease protein